MDLPSGINGLHGIGVGLLFIGLILHVVGLATPNWSLYPTGETRGLWAICPSVSCNDIPSDLITDELKSARIFAVMAVLDGVGGVSLASLHIVRRIQAKPEINTLKLANLVAGIAALVCVVISCSVYGTGVQKTRGDSVGQEGLDVDIGYSLILSAVGGLIICIGSVMFQVACLIKS